MKCKNIDLSYLCEDIIFDNIDVQRATDDLDKKLRDTIISFLHDEFGLLIRPTISSLELARISRNLDVIIQVSSLPLIIEPKGGNAVKIGMKTEYKIKIR